MPETISVSVRGMVELVLRSGSIDSRYMSLKKRAYEGMIIHQKLQKKRKAQAEAENTVYEREVVLKKRFEYEEFVFLIDGRADGILKLSDNIRTTSEADASLREYSASSEADASLHNHSVSSEADASLREYSASSKADTSLREYSVIIEEIKSTAQPIETSYSINQFSSSIQNHNLPALTPSNHAQSFPSDNPARSFPPDTPANSFTLGNPSHWHWAQLKCYGFMYASENALDKIGLRLTYCNIETEQTAEYEYGFGIGELTAFFYQLIELYYVFARIDLDRISERNITCHKLEFPFANYRKNQRELAAAVYKAIRNGSVLFAQAPTGTGKTISTVFPAVKALGTGLCSKVFYLTAKTTTRQAACDALAVLASGGLAMRSVVLTAKDKICPNSSAVCGPSECPYANGHFDRVNSAILDIIKSECLITREILLIYAEKHNVCPFEFGLDVTGFCDFIVCDYNHVYDPGVRLRRYFDDKNDFCLLIDEAHNLVDRARDMFSAALSKSEFTKIKKLLKTTGKLNELNKPAANLAARPKSYARPNAELIRKITKIISHFKSPQKDVFKDILTEFAACTDAWLAANEGNEHFSDIIELYFDVLDYLRINDFFDERYEFFIDSPTSVGGDITTSVGGDITVKLLCLDPSFLLGKVHSRVGAVILFSATLSPPGYFIDILGGVDNCAAVSAPSPYAQSNLAVFIDARVSARYANRAASLDIISFDLYALLQAKPGNYLAFFPSYAYMNAVYERFTQHFPQTEVVRQLSAMSEQERDEFLTRFDSDNSGAMLGFAVMGGVFSEGIDLLGDKLIGAAIISVGLPLITKERDLLAQYYGNKLGMGFEYAYKYPGMIKVLQAAGRVIRSESDCGTVLLLDDRFAQYNYRALFPAEWSHAQIIRKEGQLEQMLSDFWIKQAMDH